MAVVVFDPQEFREAYPRFFDPKTGQPLLTDAQLRQAFDVACLLLDNTNSSPVPYDPAHGIMIRKTLLYLLVCHLATLALWPMGQAGPVASATEGTVSISFSVPQDTGKAFYAQTPCGQTFLAGHPALCRGRSLLCRPVLASVGVMVSGELEKLLKRYITPDIVVKAGVLENATRGEGGTPVAEYAAYNEYGATIEIPERTQTLYFKRKRDGSVGNRFVKKGKSDFAQDASVKAHTVTIPSRPFLRSTLDAKADAWCDNLAEALEAGRTPKEAMRLVGRRMADDIQATIKSNMPPDNAESTKRRKNAKGAGKGTLIDSGSLLKSIDYEVVKK